MPKAPWLWRSPINYLCHYWRLFNKNQYTYINNIYTLYHAICTHRGRSLHTHTHPTVAIWEHHSEIVLGRHEGTGIAPNVEHAALQLRMHRGDVSTYTVITPCDDLKSGSHMKVFSQRACLGESSIDQKNPNWIKLKRCYQMPSVWMSWINPTNCTKSKALGHPPLELRKQTLCCLVSCKRGWKQHTKLECYCTFSKSWCHTGSTVPRWTNKKPPNMMHQCTFWKGFENS